MAPRVSVVIPCHNYGRFLSEAIESALGQTHRPFEVIVVDDGSTDDSAVVAARYEPHVQILKQANAGVARARNVGAARAAGDWLCFLDADDVLLPTKLEEQVSALSEHPELDVVSCGWQDIDEAGALLAENVPTWERPAIEHFLAGVSFPPHCGLVRRSAYQRVGGFCELPVSRSWPEDTDLWLRLTGTGSRLLMLPRVLCQWRKHASTVSRSEDIEASHLGFERMIERLVPMELFLAPPAALRRYGVLVEAAFAARYWQRGDLAAARATVRGLLAKQRSEAARISFARELVARALNEAGPQRHAAIQGKDELEARVAELMSDLSDGIRPRDTRTLRALAGVHIASRHYAAGRGRRARAAVLRSAAIWAGVLFMRETRGIAARALIGPTVIRSLRNLTGRVRAALPT